MQQLTKEQAIRFYESGVWQDMSAQEKVEMQLFQDRLAMPFGEFLQAMESVLGRPVYTHEFADKDSLQKEFLGEIAPPTFDEIVGKIPEEKRMIIFADSVN